MRYQNRVIGAGDALYVLHEGKWVDWVISDWSEGTGDIYGRRTDGPYERMPMGARFTLPPIPTPRAPAPNHDTYGSWSLGPPKVALGPKLADLCRQGYPPN